MDRWRNVNVNDRSDERREDLLQVDPFSILLVNRPAELELLNSRTRVDFRVSFLLVGDYRFLIVYAPMINAECLPSTTKHRFDNFLSSSL